MNIKETTKSVIKIIDKENNKKLQDTVKDSLQPPVISQPIIQKEIQIEQIDDLLDLFNEKILSLIKIYED